MFTFPTRWKKWKFPETLRFLGMFFAGRQQRAGTQGRNGAHTTRTVAGEGSLLLTIPDSKFAVGWRSEYLSKNFSRCRRMPCCRMARICRWCIHHTAGCAYPIEPKCCSKGIVGRVYGFDDAQWKVRNAFWADLFLPVTRVPPCIGSCGAPSATYWRHALFHHDRCQRPSINPWLDNSSGNGAHQSVD